MTQSVEINELAAALSKAQGEMQAAIKDKVNPFFKSSYADLGSVWDAARPVLSKYGLCIMQTTELSADGTRIVMVTTLAHTSGQWMKSYLPLNPEKNNSQGIGASITYLRRYSLSAIVGVVCDEDDDGETNVGRGKAQQQAVQPLNQNQQGGLVCDEDDDGETNVGRGKAQQQAVQPLNQNQQGGLERVEQSQVAALAQLINSLDKESNKSFFEWIKKNFNAASVQEIPKTCFEKCMVSLNAKIKYLNDKNREAVAV